MDPVRRTTPPYRRSPFFLQLQSLDTKDGDLWTFSFEPELLTLLAPGDQRVLKLHRDEAARYMRFEYDVLRGPTISLIIVEGLKRYSFRCHQEHIEKLLSWLPHLSPEEVQKQVRTSGITVALIGLFHVLLPQVLLWFWGIVLFAVGFAGIVRARRSMYLLNGAALFLVGLWALLFGTPGELRPWNVPPETRLLTIAVGTIALLWAVHQMSMLGPNRQLRVARAIRDARVSFLPERSRLVRRIGWTNLWAGIGFAIYAGADLALTPPLPSAVATAIRPMPLDVVVFGVLAVLSLGMAGLLLKRKRPAYFEAKLAGQLLVTVLTFSVWSLILQYAVGRSEAGFAGVFAPAPTVFTRHYVWGTLMLCVLVFNRWYMRVVDRELEEQRG